MTEPPFFWRGADAIGDFIDWQESQQADVDAAIIAAVTCPIVEDDGE